MPHFSLLSLVYTLFICLCTLLGALVDLFLICLFSLSFLHLIFCITFNGLFIYSCVEIGLVVFAIDRRLPLSVISVVHLSNKMKNFLLPLESPVNSIVL